MKRLAVLERVLCAATLLGAALLALPALAGERGPRPHVTAVRTETPPTIDGRLNETDWQRAAPITRFRQREPVEFAPPTQKTEVRILYDSDALYIAFRCYDSEPEKIKATHLSRDDLDIRYDDRVSVTIDTPRDERSGYFFMSNAAGMRLDGLAQNSRGIWDWDGIWNARGRIDDAGYTVEMVIPFKSLNIDPDQTTWGLEIFRGIPRRGETMMWSNPSQSSEFLSVEQAGYLDGLTGLEQGLGLDMTLNLAARYVDDGTRKNFAGDAAGTGTVVDTGHSFSDTDPGVDLFYRLTPSLSASLTTNTDFGDTEVDTRQVNLTRFDLFFPEKRRFFLKDSGVFDFGDLKPAFRTNRSGIDQNGRPFFSRRIGLSSRTVVFPNGQSEVEAVPVDIRAGIKLSGRAGPFNLGLLTVQTADQRVLDEALAIDGRTFQTPRKIDEARLTVARVALDILEESNLGIIFTHGDPDRDQADRGLGTSWLLGADLNLRSSTLFENRTIESNFWAQKSQNPSSLVVASESNTREWAWGGRVLYPNDRFNWELGFKQLGQQFRPALGFVNQPGIRRYDARFRYRFRPQHNRIKIIDNEFVMRWNEQLDGNVADARLDVRPFRLENYTGDSLELLYALVWFRTEDSFRLLGANIIPGRYIENRVALRLRTADIRPIRIDINLGYGGFFDRGGTVIRTAITWRPSPHFNIQISYDQNDFDLGFPTPVPPPPSIPALPLPMPNNCADPATQIFCTGDDVTSRVVSGRVEFNFTPDMSWNTLVQFDNQSDNIGINSRFRWIVEPGREVFLVLNHGMLYDGSDDDLQRLITEPRIKISWLYRF